MQQLFFQLVLMFAQAALGNQISQEFGHRLLDFVQKVNRINKCANHQAEENVYEVQVEVDA